MLAAVSRRVHRLSTVRSSLGVRRLMSTSIEKDEDGIYNVNTKADWDALLATGKPIVADFWAPWCGKCNQIAGFVNILAEDFPDVTFVKLNVGEEGVGPIKAEYNVEVLPAFMFFKEGQQVHTPVLGYKKKPLKDTVQLLAAP
ncbi:hypothetical protein H310_10222 [Aphanomyces invadans]|uniref:Thioredoxin domain-containing protein n=1 Tax=Aphanomyces invadans TaxID=157072 RepID=A0A024TR80_9STRA|nr:hypothetical protein H310_10222 [Aphanomyces invadans]ETV96494.1 hypothetical protein H310_10222 [Aphanomyces invadans]|eukprot:XP_008874757.1 hypothetical protein H310_10222 [Aphanomyces invadans]